MEVIDFKYTKNWYEKTIERGIDYAFKSLNATYNRMGSASNYQRFMRIVVGEIAQSAIDTYLLELGINVSHNGKTKWYEIDKYDLSYGNYQFDSKATMVKSNSMGFGISHQEILNYSALVPKDQFIQKNRSSELKKAYIFPVIETDYDPFSFGNCVGWLPWDFAWTNPPKKCPKCFSKGVVLQKLYDKCSSKVGKISFNHNGEFLGSKLKIYGTDSPRSSKIEEIEINNNKVQSKTDFFQLFGVRLFSEKQPNSELIINANSSSSCSKPIIKKLNNSVSSKNDHWNNFYTKDNLNIYLGGFITKEQMQIIGKNSKRFDKQHKQYAETKVDNLFCYFSDLNPLNEISTLK